ncbi:uncharacterized protein TNCV_397191 [Trichonephila clavipes]|nr:uncharacterized protein TNCV_397191 [Trichonephila clavipes]
MAFLSKGKKIDLYNLASELRVSVTLEDKIIDLREKITSCTFFLNNEQVVKEMLDNIVDERKSLEIEALKKIEREDALKKIEREDKYLADQRAFELEKLKLQAQNPPASVGNSSQMDSKHDTLNIGVVDKWPFVGLKLSSPKWMCLDGYKWPESNFAAVESIPNKWYSHQEGQPCLPQSISICTGSLYLALSA